MAEIVVAHRPDLTVERAVEVFRSHFGETYEVYNTSIWGRDFVVKKNGRTAVGIRLKQQDKTSFIFTAFTPSFLFKMMFSGLLSYLILRPGWKAIEGEVAHFIRNSADLN